MNFAEGTLWSEPGAGTNAIGTAIAADHAVQVFGPEHFNEVVQRWTCSAAPIHDPDTGELLGVIDLTGDFSTVHPHSLAVATATAQAVEAWLRLEMQEHDARLRARYGDRVAVAPGSRALVTPNGRPITRRPGQLGRPGPRWRSRPAAGALTLPSGAHAIAESVGPAEEAFLVRAAERRGAAGHPAARAPAAARPRARAARGRRPPAPSCARGSARSSRCCARTRTGAAPTRCAPTCTATRAARRACAWRSRACASCSGPWIDTERYRLTCDVESDVRRVEGLLRTRRRPRGGRGATRGRCCPARRRPAIVARARAARRLAAPGGDDRRRPRGPVGVGADAPPAGTTSARGSACSPGCEFRDPRRSLCAARIGELRRVADLTPPPGADAAPL